MAPAKYISGLTRLVLEPFPYRAPLVKNRLEGLGFFLWCGWCGFALAGKWPGFFRWRGEGRSWPIFTPGLCGGDDDHVLSWDSCNLLAWMTCITEIEGLLIFLGLFISALKVQLEFLSILSSIISAMSVGLDVITARLSPSLGTITRSLRWKSGPFGPRGKTADHQQSRNSGG